MINDKTEWTAARSVLSRRREPLRISGAMKVAAGVTTVDEVMKVATSDAGPARAAA
jgi:hypothetical protein